MVSIVPTVFSNDQLVTHSCVTGNVLFTIGNPYSLHLRIAHSTSTNPLLHAPSQSDALQHYSLNDIANQTMLAARFTESFAKESRRL